MTLDDLQRLLRPLGRRVSTMVSRVVLRAVDDAPGRQEVQAEGFADELHPRVEHFQPFGLRARPPVGSEGIGLAVGGARNHLVVLALSAKDAGNQALDDGDVLLYCIDPDTYTRLKASGALETKARTSWAVRMAGLENKQFVSMTPGETIVQVEDPNDPAKKSRITITPTMVKIETQNFIHP